MLIDRVINFMTSLRLTVVCLGFGLLLVFIGTLAQVDEGLYQAQTRYFKSFVISWKPAEVNWGNFNPSDDNPAYIKLAVNAAGKIVHAAGKVVQGVGWLGAKIFGPNARLPVFPGGYLIGTVLLVNLIAAHIRRFKFTPKKIGIWMVHMGLILLLVGQLLTDMLSQESVMHLRIGETKNYTVENRRMELAVIDATDPDNDKVVAIPESFLAKEKIITQADLPFTIKVEKFYPNSSLSEQVSAEFPKTDANQLPGSEFGVKPEPRVTSTDFRDIPSAVIELTTRESSLGKWLVSGSLNLQSFTMGNRTYRIGIRPVRFYKPFSLHLVDFRHAIYKGTDVPKDFSSIVRLQRPSTGEDREVRIYMNNPLRYNGETYYQADWDHEDDRGTVLQVVHNPGWLTPYISCGLVLFGLLIQFSMHLIVFVIRRITA
jgi:hypothetical protein